MCWRPLLYPIKIAMPMSEASSRDTHAFWRQSSAFNCPVTEMAKAVRSQAYLLLGLGAFLACISLRLWRLRAPTCEVVVPAGPNP